MSNKLFIAAIVAAVGAAGCASVASLVGVHQQSVSVQTRTQDQAELNGVLCELENKNGKRFVTTPGSVMIPRASGDLQVVCKKAGQETGRATVVSEFKPVTLGNILAGGALGAVVDYNNGAAYEYPESIQVVMGTASRIELPRTQDQAERQAAMAKLAAPPKSALEVARANAYRSYTLLPSGAVIADSARAIDGPKLISVTTVSVAARFKETRDDFCDAYLANGDYCWWSPPTSYSMCPLSPSLSLCKAKYGADCKLGHGKVFPLCLRDGLAPGELVEQ